MKFSMNNFYNFNKVFNKVFNEIFKEVSNKVLKKSFVTLILDQNCISMLYVICSYLTLYIEPLLTTALVEMPLSSMYF